MLSFALPNLAKKLFRTLFIATSKRVSISSPASLHCWSLKGERNNAALFLPLFLGRAVEVFHYLFMAFVGVGLRSSTELKARAEDGVIRPNWSHVLLNCYGPEREEKEE